MNHHDHFIDVADDHLIRMRLLIEGAISIFEETRIGNKNSETADKVNMIGQALFDLRIHICQMQDAIRAEGERIMTEASGQKDDEGE